MNDLVRAASLFGGPRAPSAGLSGVLGAAPAQAGAAPVADGALRFTGRVTAVTHAGQPVLSTPIGSRLTLALPAEALP